MNHDGLLQDGQLPGAEKVSSVMMILSLDEPWPHTFRTGRPLVPDFPLAGRQTILAEPFSGPARQVMGKSKLPVAMNFGRCSDGALHDFSKTLSLYVSGVYERPIYREA